MGVLEEKVRSLDDQLKVMYDQKNMAEKRARRCELDVKDLEDRLRNADRELANSGVYRDGLRGDKEKVGFLSVFGLGCSRSTYLLLNSKKTLSAVSEVHGEDGRDNEDG